MKKGSFGYLARKRKASIAKSALFLAAVLLIYFAALHYFHTNRNVFSILAAVGALPTGRSIVETIMCLRARSASEAVREAVSGVSGLPGSSSGFDLYLTAYERAYSLSHITVSEGAVLGLTEDPRTDCRQCEDHICKMLEQAGKEDRQVTVFDDLDSYIGAVSDLCADSGFRGDPEAMRTLLAVSL